MTTLVSLFTRQRELMEKFEEIEKNNGLLEYEGVVRDYDNARFQMKARRLAWQITEEIGEAVEIRALGSSDFVVEVADAFHFLLELIIVCEAIGIFHESTLEEIFEDLSTPVHGSDPWLNVIVQLSRAANLLKNRPHKRISTPTPASRLKTRLRDTFYAFGRACIYSDITAMDLASAYFGKAKLNDGRIEGGV